MGYLFYNIPFFLLIAALLGFVIGWLLRGNRFQSELQDLDARWRSKLGEVESERDRFAGEVSQANEARAKHEAAVIEAKRLAETHEASLAQLRREHQTKLSALGDVEKRASGLEKELAASKTSLSKQQGAGSDSQRLGKELAAATGRAETLERDLSKAREANSACKREVERLEARISDLQRANAGDSGGALGLMGSADSTTSDSASAGTGGGSSSPAAAGSFERTGGSDDASSGPSGGSAGSRDSLSGSSGGSAPLGLVGGTDAVTTTGAGSAPGGQGQSGHRQEKASSPSAAESGGRTLEGSGSGDGRSNSASQENEGTQPEALTGAKGGVADDLKKISGVGPKLEKTLNSLGIFHFSQIAAFTPDNVAWVDRHLRFKGRIERENWIEQAKTLAAGNQTEFSRRN